jgi:branched-chain amino acid transport system substrate-binding protein
VNWYTYYAGGAGGPTAIKQANLNHKVFAIAEGAPNIAYAPSQQTEKAFREKYHVTNIYPRAFNEMRMLAAAISKAGDSDMSKVATGLEDMKWEVFSGGDGYMRKDDHQFFQPMYIASFGDRTPDERFDEENTGWGWRVDAKIGIKDTVLPTTCKMTRPLS